MTEMKTHAGGCHCGKIRFEVQADVKEAMACNCSICSKTGALLTFVGASQFKLLAGEGQLTDYQFGKKHIHHRFCQSCGMRSFADGAGPDGNPMYAINLRCLDDIDLSALQVKEFDGKSL